MKNIPNNEQGFVLVLSLIMLVVLTVLGIAATNTTIIELRISANDKLTQQTFYRADAVTREAMGHLLINSLDIAPAWMLPADNTIMPAIRTNPIHLDDLVLEQTNVRDETIWNSNSHNSEIFLTTQTQMMVAHRGVAPGSSLDLGASRIHAFEAYGRSQQNNSQAIVKTGFRNSFP